MEQKEVELVLEVFVEQVRAEVDVRVLVLMDVEIVV